VTDPHGLHIVLDKSAVLDYLTGNIAVGEALTLLLDEIEPAYFGVHLTTLAEADLEQTDETEDAYLRTVKLLMAHVAFQPLTLDRNDMDELLELANDFGSVELATALVTATRYDALVLTKHQGRYADRDGAPHDRVIGI
jgi:hypothetical protein